MAGNFLEAVELTSSGRPVLLPSEIECSLLSAVDLECEDLPNFPNLKSGILTLTTHRLLWVSDSSSQGASSAIPLASISHIFSAKKSLKSIFASPRIRFQLSVSPDGRVSNSGSGSRSVVVTVVVRGKGADLDVFLTKFWDNWRGRAWETGNADVTSGSESVSGSTSSGLYTKEGTVRMVGVSGILRKEQEMWETTDKSLQDAFQDLNALMSKAKEMVMLAEKMRQKLLSGSTSQPGAAEDEELGSKQDMQDWLLSVGIISPVTKESAGALYHQQLSRQLADFVRLPLERAGGMMNLIDIYCLFNRARGTELISPEDLLQACFLWEKFDVPVMLRKFDSGVMVIQNKSHSDEEIFARIKTLATKPDALRTGVSASDAAITLGIAPGMAKEHLLTAESKGFLCRDISPDGFRFYINLFPDIDPNNVYLVKDYGVYDTWLKVASASR
ncbi:vacuolar protein sorting-associated protein 36 [Rosa rugosa]|uniref:vacuolar protein sorting-associated protein 36 n=1 Tax=Rosa rugosa TaxID=74645 RepID=UPI002B40CFF9|nr:vacuolar protein sorting-associated protein 36 [Rosa rugosa]XP_061996819.1 vacuolar protein sorting-associated protein 36 [Rosa rugosa]XP_061996820.1 vacuolar protein sorting-associated protein 36 [Rosa rugosa]XP_061996821.1 vacuolar protein sorting-associated protein 36 [Rosa rugosa]